MATGVASLQRNAAEPREECSSGESKAGKRQRRAANAARELVQDIAANDTDSEAEETRPNAAKVAKKTSAATAGAGGAGRAKLPRPEGIACCPRCSSKDTKFCYYNNYNIKQPRYFCKGCQRYWTEGGMLRNVPPGSGRRKNKNATAREAEKAATADAAKQQNAIAAGAYEQFQHLLMNPSLAYGPGNSMLPPGVKPAGSFGSAVVTGMGPGAPPLPAAAGLSGFGMFPSLGVPSLGYDPAKALVAPDSVRISSGSGAVLATEPVSALLGGPPTVTTSTVTTSSVPSINMELKAAAAGAKADAEPTLVAKNPAAAALVNGLPAPMLAPMPGSAVYGGPTSSGSGPHNGGPQNDWVSMAAAGQMQAAVQQQQLQQAAALQAQAHLQAAAANFGQQQNPYLSNMWPYNMYSTGPNWAAAAYARLGQPQPWQAGEAGAAPVMSGGSGPSGLVHGPLPPADGGGMLAPGGGPGMMAPPMLGAPMWQQWSPPGAGAWGPMGGVPVTGIVPAHDKAMLSTGGSMMSGGSNNSTATLLGQRSMPAS